jgi:hypothetical protein
MPARLSPLPLCRRPHRHTHRKGLNRVDAWRMIQRRAAELGTRARIGCHTFCAAGITT